MSPAPEDRLATARAAVAELLADVEKEGRRGAFWLPRLHDLGARLGAQDRPAEQVLTEATELHNLLYAAPRDNFSDFYLTNVDGPNRAAENRRFVAAAETLRTALRG